MSTGQADLSPSRLKSRPLEQKPQINLSLQKRFSPRTMKSIVPERSTMKNKQQKRKKEKKNKTNADNTFLNPIAGGE
jgi:hypothetical protein